MSILSSLIGSESSNFSPLALSCDERHMSVGLESALDSGCPMSGIEAHDLSDGLAMMGTRDASSLLFMPGFAKQNKTDTQRVQLGVGNSKRNRKISSLDLGSSKIFMPAGNLFENVELEPDQEQEVGSRALTFPTEEKTSRRQDTKRIPSLRTSEKEHQKHTSRTDAVCQSLW